MIEIRLPKPGPEIEEATITSWERTEGDKIESGDILAIIKTSIGSFKVAAEEEGVLDAILQNTGASIDFEEPIAILRSEVEYQQMSGSSEAEDSTLPLPIEEEAEKEETIHSEVASSETGMDDLGEEFQAAENPSDTDDDSPKLKLQEPDASAEVDSQPSASETTERKHPAFVAPNVEISPAARKIAERLGIDLSKIEGSGEDGKILYIDIENAVNDLEVRPSDSEAPVESSPDPSIIEDMDPGTTPDDSESLDPLEASESLASTEASMEAIAFENGNNGEIEEPPPSTPDEPTADDDLIALTTPDSPLESEDANAAQASLQSPQKAFPDFEEISIQFHLTKKEDLIIPFNTVKKAFSEKQAQSNSQVPHFHLFAEVDFTEAQKWRKDFNRRQKVDITITDLMVKSCGHALALMPEMNAFVRPDRIVLKRSINIGVTTAVDEGVVTPVVPDVYHKSLNKVSEVVKKNTELAMNSKVVLDYDTTFTISNLGMYGVKRFVPLIVPPQTASLAVGEVRKKVIPVDDFIGIRSIMELTLACDHRAIDGTTAARFIQTIRKDLEGLKEGEDPDWIKGNEQLRLI